MELAAQKKRKDPVERGRGRVLVHFSVGTVMTPAVPSLAAVGLCRLHGECTRLCFTNKTIKYDRS